jgi:hypothetical protein
LEHIRKQVIEPNLLGWQSLFAFDEAIGVPLFSTSVSNAIASKWRETIGTRTIGST